MFRVYLFLYSAGSGIVSVIYPGIAVGRGGAHQGVAPAPAPSRDAARPAGAVGWPEAVGHVM